MKKGAAKVSRRFFERRADGPQGRGCNGDACKAHPSRNTAGVALLIVLGMLVILSVIVIAFMSRVTTDLADSKGYESQTNVRMLADSAVNLVIAQIRQASTSSSNAWISQPGLIRTYDTSGNPVTAFKLYSSSQMSVTGAFDPSAGADLPTGNAWLSQPNLYIDLNSPVTSGTNLPVFPIIDGNALQSITESGTTLLSYSTDGVNPDIQGFGTNPAAVGITYTPGTTPTGTTNPVPMPVQWLYMLKDGTLLPATAGSGANVTVGSGATTPSGTNPIVARVAFWTDDETAKVNINTASEGTFWDTPVCDTQPYPPYGSAGASVDVNRVYEWDLGMYQGAQKEYQRYPGHPATTCLSPVLGVWIRNALGIPLSGTMTASQRQQFVNAITTITPRVTDSVTASSMGGTQRALAVVTPDTDRLYATPDELLYTGSSSPRVVQNVAGTTTLSGSTSDPRPLVEKTKFFLTTDSKAPEQNLYNMPRIAIWPITKSAINSTTDTTRMTALDKLIAFCSTVGGTSANALPFYFTRQDPTSMTTDWGTRNAALYSYLQTLTGQAAPGFGGNFATKYGTDRNQILTEMFDYIRCTNLVDATAPAGGAYTGSGSIASGQVVPIVPGNGTRGFGRIATLPELALVMLKTDTRINPNLQEDAPVATNVISGTTYTYTDTPHPNWKNVVEPNNATVGGATYTGPKLIGGNLTYDPTQKTQIQCALIPHLFSPMAGFPALYNDISLNFHSEIGAIQITDQSGTSQTPFQTIPVTMSGTGGPFLSGSSDNECKIGGDIGAMTLFVNNTTVTPPTTGTFVVSGTSLLSSTGAQTVGSQLTIASTPFAVDIIAPDINKGGSVIQTLNFQFNGTVPIPKLALTYTGTSTLHPVATWTAQPVFPLPGGSRLGTRCDNGAGTMIQDNVWASQNGVNSGDTVRSLVATGGTIKGDFRLLAMSGTVPASTFQYPPNANGTTGATHSMRHSYLVTSVGGDGGGMWSSAQFGTLIQGPSTNAGLNNWGIPTYGNSICSYIPGGINGVFLTDSNGASQNGDWDNGPAFVGDGPLLNKVDEGTGVIVNSSTNQAPYVGFFSAGEGSIPQSGTFFSPNRQVSSPVMFGSLPTGVLRGQPWQTLLFHPARSYLPGGAAHPGAATPPDHLLLDLFWMPVVEPYPISEPFATGGKINLNYQIAPFNYITRKTGLYAVLQSAKLTALNPNQNDYRPADVPPGSYAFSKFYKSMGTYQQASSNGAGGGVNVSVRRNIDIDDTLREMDYRFSQNQPFISASEICTVPLIPADQTDPSGKSPYLNAGITSTDTTGLTGSIETKLATFWNANAAGDHTSMTGHFLTGDNSLERPYSSIYPRLTTRSNTYTVHVRVQTLKKNPFTGAANFVNGEDQVTGEFRGSFVVERYLDPTTAGFVDSSGQSSSGGVPYTEASPNVTLGPYRFRVISSKQFAP
ncbi:MAG: Verru_Chthon cassette protein A [Chthoniobacteraceae bacterium]